LTGPPGFDIDNRYQLKIVINNFQSKGKNMRKIAVAALAVLLCPLGLRASDRHFTFNYESDVLGAGGKELETYTTFKFGRDLYYSALDQRLEFEVGLGGNAQTSLYLNFEQEMADDGTGNVASSFLADGISNEWKFKLKDNLTDDFGLAVYFENAFKPDEYELETKLILDKRSGGWLWALNLTAEPEYHFIDNTFALSLIPSMGFGAFLLPDRLFLGLEFQNDTFFEGAPLAPVSSVFSAGPVVSYALEDWWVTLTFLPQWVNWLGPGLDFSESQRFQVRLAASVSLGSHPPPPAEALPVPGPKDARRASRERTVSLMDLNSGKKLYLQNCASCHQLHAPSEFTAGGWDKIMAKMSGKAKINGEASGLILDYLTAFSKDSNQDR
jgi:mono/diheme cytochrome c family protein